MNTGIVVYSRWGNTLSVALKLRDGLTAVGHDVSLTELATVESLGIGDTTTQLRSVPSVDDYDAAFFACPAQVLGTESVRWPGPRRVRRASRVVGRLVALLADGGSHDRA
jgi:hypothetical protein